LTHYKIELTLHPNQEFRVSNTKSAAFAATKILLPIDFSPSSEAALEAATGLAQQFHADIHLVHIIPEVPDFNGSDFFPETAVLQERRETIEEKLQRYKKQVMLEGVSFQPTLALVLAQHRVQHAALRREELIVAEFTRIPLGVPGFF
jgi:nucleotide-binding universal stress UspA family protein